MKLIGAGVIPFFRDSKGEPHFVFGRERFSASWRASNKLSSFGGGVHGHETASVTAAREFREESLSSFPTHALEEGLTRGEYALRVVTHSCRPNVAYHVTYIKEYPPDDMDFLKRFETNRLLQLELQDSVRTWKLARQVVDK